MALGSCNVLLEYIKHGPGMSCSRQNAWELGRLLSFGRARCGRSVGGLCLEVCCLRCRVLGCVFQCWMLASMSSLLMVCVGIGSWLKLFCTLSLGARFGISVFLCRLRSRKEVRLGLWRVLAPLVLRGVYSG